MGYPASIYIKAQNTLDCRRENAETEQKKRHDEAAAKIPELLEIEKKVSETGLAAVKAIGMGENAAGYLRDLSKQNLEAQKIRRKLLTAAGFSPDFLEYHPVCGTCSDKGFIGGKPCACLEALARSIALAELSENSPASTSTFESFNLEYYPKTADPETGISPYGRMSEIFKFCKDYADDFSPHSPSLYMHGKTGLGKTHLSLATAVKVVTMGFGVIYGSAQNLIGKIEREHFGRNKGDTDTEQAVLNCDLLIVDDLGAEFSTTFTVSTIYNIINTRLSKGSPVIISTNLTPEELEHRYSERIASRIAGNYISLQFFGRDVRQLKRMR